MLDYFMQLWFNNMCEINTLISKVIIFFFYCFENPKRRVYLLKKFQITQYYVNQEVKGLHLPMWYTGQPCGLLEVRCDGVGWA